MAVSAATLRSVPATPRDLTPLKRFAGKFVVFDGPDGSGKTTQFLRAVQFWRDLNLPVCEVREPGGTDVGEAIRDVLLHRREMHITPLCEMLLYMASRAQLVETRIRPAVARGELVLADRFVSSTLAYQGSAGGVPEADIRAVEAAACGEIRPDLVVIFDVDEATALVRMGRAPDRSGPDRMESKGGAFRAKVRQGYLEQAKADASRHLVIDARADEDEVALRLVAGLLEWIARR